MNSAAIKSPYKLQTQPKEILFHVTNLQCIRCLESSRNIYDTSCWQTRILVQGFSISISIQYHNKKAVLSQRWPRKFSGLLTTPTATIPNIFHGLMFGSTLWMFEQNLKSVTLPVPEIVGGTQKIWAVPGYAHASFSPKFLTGFYSDWPCIRTRQIWSQYLYPFLR